MCLVDDAQWLDEASALTLGFVARRLLAESVLLVFAVREPPAGETLPDLPELPITGLPDRESRTLLESVVTGRLDHRVRDRILGESRGNPLALLELPRGLAPAEMAGGFVSPAAGPCRARSSRAFSGAFKTLPVEARRLLLTAAADPVGDVTLLRRAAERLGIDVDAAAAQADTSELVTLGTRVRFRHPLVRSAVYGAASPSERQEAHRALGESIDAEVDPDRRAWHRAQAAPGPDEDVAEELERCAVRAQARGGIAAMAAFLERATALTPEPNRRADRALDAAQAKLQAGAFEPAAALIVMAEAGTPRRSQGRSDRFAQRRDRVRAEPRQRSDCAAARRRRQARAARRRTGAGDILGRCSGGDLRRPSGARPGASGGWRSGAGRAAGAVASVVRQAAGRSRRSSY